MFIGMIGYTYGSGLITVWFMLGWVLGDYIGLRTILRPVVVASHNDDSRSMGSLLAHWLGVKPFKYFGIISGVITVLFLTIYSAAQFKAGSKSLDALFGLDQTVTISLSAGLVLLYCFSGGIRASIWTDAAQSIVMIVGMSLLMFIGFYNLKDADISGLPEGYLSLVPGVEAVFMTLLGALGGGLMITGQPQVVSRFFTLRSADDAGNLRFYYYLWFISFYVITVTVGVLCRLLLKFEGGFDKEMALPKMAQQFLPDVGVGLILAAIFAATISTADSLILACTAAIDEELNYKKSESLKATKTITFAVLAAAVLIALYAQKSIFALVLDAWAMLGVFFTPLLVSRCFNRRFSEKSAIIISLSSLALFVLLTKAHAILPAGTITQICEFLKSYYLIPLTTLTVAFAACFMLSSKCEIKGQTND